jgi:hypothetical protein
MCDPCLSHPYSLLHDPPLFCSDVVHEQFLDALAVREDTIRAVAVQLAHEQKQLEVGQLFSFSSPLYLISSQCLLQDAIAKIHTLRTEREDVRVGKHAEALGTTAGACKGECLYAHPTRSARSALTLQGLTDRTIDRLRLHLAHAVGWRRGGR